MGLDGGVSSSGWSGSKGVDTLSIGVTGIVTFPCENWCLFVTVAACRDCVCVTTNSISTVGGKYDFTDWCKSSVSVEVGVGWLHDGGQLLHVGGLILAIVDYCPDRDDEQEHHGGEGDSEELLQRRFLRLNSCNFHLIDG